MDHLMLNIGDYQIPLYSICIMAGVAAASILISHEAKKYEFPKNFISNLIFYVVLFGILGARIYYVIFNLDYYLKYPSEIYKMWHGGLAIHGGIIFGLITLIIYCKKYNIKILKILDISLPGVMLAQAIGRWGNFFNGEAHGGVVTRDFLKSLFLPNYIIEGMHIDGNYYHPTFLYESFFCVLGVIIMLLVRNMKKTKTGNTASIYFIWYGILRFFIESLRTDSLMLGNLKVAQLVSIIMSISGIVMFVITYKNNPLYKEDKINYKK